MENKKEEFKRISKDNRETIVNWVKALRSGKYEQGSETLYCGGKHCCLGVLVNDNFRNPKLMVFLEKEREPYIHSIEGDDEFKNFGSLDSFYNKVGFLPVDIQEFLARLNDLHITFKASTHVERVLYNHPKPLKDLIEPFLGKEDSEAILNFCIKKLEKERKMSFDSVATVIEVMFNLK